MMALEKLIKDCQPEFISEAKKCQDIEQLKNFLADKNLILTEDQMNEIFAYFKSEGCQKLSIDDMDSIAGGKTGEKITETVDNTRHVIIKDSNNKSTINVY